MKYCFTRYLDEVKFLESFGATFGITAAVKVTYKNQQKVLITNQEAIEAKSFDGTIPDFVIGDPEEAIAAAKHVVSSVCFIRSHKSVFVLLFLTAA